MHRLPGWYCHLPGEGKAEGDGEEVEDRREGRQGNRSGEEAATEPMTCTEDLPWKQFREGLPDQDKAQDILNLGPFQGHDYRREQELESSCRSRPPGGESSVPEGSADPGTSCDPRLTNPVGHRAQRLRSLIDAPSKTETWREEYNRFRQPGPLGDMTPSVFAKGDHARGFARAALRTA